MADPVFIAVDDGVAGADLVRCLARHGLAATQRMVGGELRPAPVSTLTVELTPHDEEGGGT